MFCFAYLGMRSLDDVDRLTMKEYRLLTKAYKIRRFEEELHIAKQAYENFAATATKEKGRKRVPVFRDFRSFFDYEARYSEIVGESMTQHSPRFTRLIDHMKEKENG